MLSKRDASQVPANYPKDDYGQGKSKFGMGSKVRSSARSE